MTLPLRKSLCASFLITSVKKTFSKISDPRKLAQDAISLTDHLMSGLAIFGLKFPSLLQYDRSRKEPPIETNMKDLYLVENLPSDTYLRERLDEVNPVYLRPAFTKLFSYIQRGKCLEEFEFLAGHYLLAIDGTGEFSSGTVCCKKEHKDGSTTYYHQMLGACIVHPNKSNVIPLYPEMIQNSDGSTKNDCERNAARRFLENFRREHPHLKVIVVEDGLASNAPHIQDLEAHNMKYILGAKRGDHEFLFQQAEESDQTEYYECTDENGVLHQFSFINEISLNKSNLNLKVNFFEYRQSDPKGKELTFSWVTNIQITKDNVYQLMRGGRARWKIENETYNTLKNLGYNFEHNYGHGKQYLSTIFCLLMMLSFLIDQIQEIACIAYRKAKKSSGTYRELWGRMRFLFEYAKISSWELFYGLLAKEVFLALDST
ncbi:MAG: transposase [Chlamydiae bacterium]|nr:transposase [Chlamydiota bacterium]